MNLIDKDELLEVMSAHCANCKKRSDYYPSKCRNCDLDDGIDVIECSETVEAIPIEWLLKFEEKCNKISGLDIGMITEAIWEWKENESNSNY